MRSDWRPAIVAALLLGATVAAATVGRGPIKAAWNGLWARHPNELQTAELQAPQHPLDIAAPPPLSEPIALPSAPAEPASQQPAAIREAAASTVATQPHSTVEPRRAPSSEDPSQVVLAIRALRNEHDPARAKSLLNRYLQTHPQGALTEDALALSIEAAMATNDPKSPDIARKYLAKYPNGRYRTMALKTLDR